MNITSHGTVLETIIQHEDEELHEVLSTQILEMMFLLLVSNWLARTISKIL